MSVHLCLQHVCRDAPCRAVRQRQLLILVLLTMMIQSQNNDALFVPISVYVPIKKIPAKCIFRIIRISKTDRMTPFL